MKNALCAVAVFALLAGHASATDKWLDTNGTASADSGIANGATITWATGTTNWNTSSTGSGGAISGWTSGTADRAFFAAGTDTVGLAYNLNVSAALTTGAVFVEEGTVTKNGGAALTVQTFDITNGGFFINSSSSLTVAAGGTTTLNGSTATFGNANTGSGGSFFGNSTANGNMSIVLNGGGSLSANGGSTAIVTILDGAGTISGTGPLTIAGNGTLRMAKATAAVTYTGATIINGRLQTSTTANSLPSATDVTINSGGEWNIQTNNQQIGSLTGAGNITSSSAVPVLTVGGSTSPAAYSGAMSGTMALTKSGAGTLTLSGTNTYTGATTVSAGTLAMNSAGAVPNGTALTLGGGTLTNKTGGLKTFTGATTLSTSSTLLENSAGENFTFSGNFTNSGGNRVLTTGNGAGTAGGNVTLSGNVFLSEATGTGRTLIFAGAGTTASPSNPNYIVSGNVQNFNGAGTAGSIQVGNASTATGATLTLTGNNTHSGATNVSTASLLNIGSANALGTSTLTMTGNGSFDNTTGGALVLSNGLAMTGGSPTFVGTNDLTLGDATTNNNRTITVTAKTLSIGNLTQDATARNSTKAGAGTLVIRGTDNHSGTTSVTGGTLQLATTANMTATSSATVSSGAKLQVDGTISSPGAITINNGGTLAGTGSIKGPVTVNGTLSPGASAESLAVGALSLMAGSTFIYEINSSLSFAAGADLVNVALTGNTLIDTTGAGVTLSVSDLAATPVVYANKFTLMSYDATKTPIGTFAGRPENSLVTIGVTDYTIHYADMAPGVNFDAPIAGSGFNYVTLTAVPEARAFLLVGLVCVVIGAARFLAVGRLQTS